MSLIYTAVTQTLGWTIVDGKKIPYSVYQKVEPLAQQMRHWESILEHLDLTDPLSAIPTIQSIASNLIESPPLKKDPLFSYLKENGVAHECNQCLSWIGEFLIHEKELREVIKSGDYKIAKMKLNDELDIYFKINDESEEPFDEMYVYSNPEMRDKVYEVMADEFWKSHETVEMDKDRDEYQIKEYRPKGPIREYKGEMNKFIDDLQGFMDKKIRRVIALQGIPGTGKSTLCLNARRLSNRTIIISNKFIQNVSKEEWEMLISVLLPTLIIIDDIDRVPQRSLETALHLFEDNNYNVPITLLTTNDYGRLPDAFLRPGRIDQIMTMPKPKEDIKIEMLKEFSKNLEIPDDYLSQDNLDLLMLLMNDESISGAYIKELMKRYWVYGTDYQVPANDEQFSKIIEKVTNNDSSTHPF